ncbi:MAG: hypothetical protein V3S14_13765, partial [Anaerolineae bacterium]
RPSIGKDGVYGRLLPTFCGIFLEIRGKKPGFCATFGCLKPGFSSAKPQFIEKMLFVDGTGYFS